MLVPGVGPSVPTAGALVSLVPGLRTGVEVRVPVVTLLLADPCQGDPHVMEHAQVPEVAQVVRLLFLGEQLQPVACLLRVE